VVSYHPAYGVWFRYAHLSKVDVVKGQSIKEGEKIGEVGNSGTTYAHLHFEGWTKEGWEVQRTYWRRYAYYPSGKTKQWVQQHYFNPLKFIEDLNANLPSPEHKEAWDWAVENGVTNGDRPQDLGTREEAVHLIFNARGK
jgi:murein DD-endopeptidase MepM/ murein hydrolase activator NlpD